MKRYLTTSEACRVLRCCERTFYRRHRKYLKPAMRRPSSRAWLWEAEDVRARRKAWKAWT